MPIPHPTTKFPAWLSIPDIALWGTVLQHFGEQKWGPDLTVLAYNVPQNGVHENGLEHEEGKHHREEEVNADADQLANDLKKTNRRPKTTIDKSGAKRFTGSSEPPGRRQI